MSETKNNKWVARLEVIASILSGLKNLLIILFLIAVTIYFAGKIRDISAVNVISIDRFDMENQESQDGELLKMKLYYELLRMRKLGEMSHLKEFTNDVVTTYSDQHSEVEIPHEEMNDLYKFAVQTFEKKQRVIGRIKRISENQLEASLILEKVGIFYTTSSSIDSLISKCAKLILAEIDPISAAAYMVSIRDPACLQVVQPLMKDDDTQNDAIALHYQGAGYLFNNDFELARKKLRQAQRGFTKESSKAPVLNNIGVSYFEQARNETNEEKKMLLQDSAEYWYKESVKADNTFYGAFYNMGNLYTIQKKYDEAKYNYKRSISINPESVAALVSLSMLNNRKKEFKEATALMKQAKEINPSHPMIIVGDLLVPRKHRLNCDSLLRKVYSFDYTINKSYYDRVKEVVGTHNLCKTTTK